MLFIITGVGGWGCVLLTSNMAGLILNRLSLLKSVLGESPTIRVGKLNLLLLEKTETMTRSSFLLAVSTWLTCSLLVVQGKSKFGL